MTRADHFRQAMLALQTAAAELRQARKSLDKCRLRWEFRYGANVDDAFRIVTAAIESYPDCRCEACAATVKLSEHIESPCAYWREAS